MLYLGCSVSEQAVQAVLQFIVSNHSSCSTWFCYCMVSLIAPCHACNHQSLCWSNRTAQLLQTLRSCSFRLQIFLCCSHCHMYGGMSLSKHLHCHSLSGYVALLTYHLQLTSCTATQLLHAPLHHVPCQTALQHRACRLCSQQPSLASVLLQL